MRIVQIKTHARDEKGEGQGKSPYLAVPCPVKSCRSSSSLGGPGEVLGDSPFLQEPSPNVWDVTLNPDVIAPKLNILTAWPNNVGPSGLVSDNRITDFIILSETLMACPHVLGLAACLKAEHPEWSLAAIRSALMTTAYTVDNQGEMILDDSFGNASTMMDYGASHVHLVKAMDSGLIYDITAYDYVDFLCNSNYTDNIQVVTRKIADYSRGKKVGRAGDLNYPSMVAVFQQYGKAKMLTHFIMTVINFGDANSIYKVIVRPSSGVTVTVHPDKLIFHRTGQKLNFLVRVEIRATKLSPGGSSMRSRSITWSDGDHPLGCNVTATYTNNR